MYRGHNCISLIFLDPESGFDFKLDSFHAGPSETFDPHYGQGGYNGDGDITKLENLQAFQEYVLEVTDGEGVHFVMADGVSYINHLYCFKYLHGMKLEGGFGIKLTFFIYFPHLTTSKHT